MLHVLAHGGQPLEPHDVWSAWNLHPVVVVGIVLAAAAYIRGWRSPVDSPPRRAAFTAGLGTLLVALVSPVDAIAGVLVSGHMVQHVLLLLVAAPLLAVSSPTGALLRGASPWMRSAARKARRRAGLGTGPVRLLRSPIARWLAYVVTLWVWHASVLYGAAVQNELVHGLQHASFVGTGVLAWSVILGPSRVRVSRGLGLLGVATLSLQSVFLSALITFASEPWYASYLPPLDGWGLDAMTDQQLAGVLMWVPSGFIHFGLIVWLLVAWIRESDAPEDATAWIAIHGSATGR